MAGVSRAQGSYLQAGRPPLFSNVLPKQRPAGSSFEFSVKTDASNVKGEDAGKAGNQSTAAAAAALDAVDSLSDLAKTLGNNPYHLSAVTFTLDRNGGLLSGGELFANGDLDVHGSGSSNGATSSIDLFVPGTQGGSGDWSTEAATGLALAAYNLNAVLDQAGGRTRGAYVNAAA